MKRLINKILNRFGYLIISRKALRKRTPAEIAALYQIETENIPVLESYLNGGLCEKLKREGKTRWLEIGCGGTFDENFTYIDLFPETLVGKKGKYFRVDITNLTELDEKKLGKFDLIRMQHVFEHFTPEDGFVVLKNCARLLNPEAYILISTPDLRKYITLYQQGTIRNGFDWALSRIAADSPDSFFFSMYTHSVQYEEHKWCYDAEGLIYQLKNCAIFKNIREIKIGDELSNIPFTHNRPLEDVCVIAQSKLF